MIVHGGNGGLGLVNVGSDPQGNTFYTAEAGDDTSGLFQVGADSFGNAIYSDNANATPPSDTSSMLQSILAPLASIYQQRQLVSINAQRAAQGLPPLSNAQIAPAVNVGLTAQTQQLLMLGGAALLFVFLMKKR